MRFRQDADSRHPLGPGAAWPPPGEGVHHLATGTTLTPTDLVKARDSLKQIKEAIHKVKGQGGLRGIGDNRNPDMLIDPKTGEVHPQMPDGTPGDSIGNIFDYLPEEP